MTRSATAWAALKAMFLSFVLTLLVGLFLAGVSEVGIWLVGPLCERGYRSICNASRFWTAHWFFYYAWLYEPLDWLLLALMIRRFARRGYRLNAAGFVCVLNGGIALLGFLVALAIGRAAYDAEGALVFAFSVLLLSAGLFFWLRKSGTNNVAAPVGA